MATKKKAPAAKKKPSAALVAKWKAFVESVEKGYGFGLYDYRNDLDVRSMLGDPTSGSRPRSPPRRSRFGKATCPTLSGATAIPRRPTQNSSRT
jgi:hypothetical protein